MCRSFVLLLCFLASASGLVISPAARPAAAAIATTRAARVRMDEVVRVEIELEQGEPCVPPSPCRCRCRLPPAPCPSERRCAAGSAPQHARGASPARRPRPAVHAHAPCGKIPFACAAAPAASFPPLRRIEKALRRFRKATNMSGHLRLLRNRKTFESAHDKKIRKTKESSMRLARARRSARNRSF